MLDIFPAMNEPILIAQTARAPGNWRLTRKEVVMTRNGLFAAVAMMMLALATGCQQPSELRPQARPVIADVPWPEGFVYDEAKSQSHSVSGGRTIDHLYKGRANKYEVLRFYQKQMTTNQWTLVREAQMQGDVLMDFDKGNERCTIIITDGNMMYPTFIKIVLSSVGRADSPPPMR